MHLHASVEIFRRLVRSSSKYCISLKGDQTSLGRGTMDYGPSPRIFSNCVFVLVHFGSIYTPPKCTNAKMQFEKILGDAQ